MAPMTSVISGLIVLSTCFMSGETFILGSTSSAGLIASSRSGVRSGRGGLYMAKHVQYKATKKHVKKRPRKTRPSDKNRKPVVYSEAVMTNGNFEGAPPVWEVLEEAEEGIDLKASVIEARAVEEARQAAG